MSEVPKLDDSSLSQSVDPSSATTPSFTITATIISPPRAPPYETVFHATGAPVTPTEPYVSTVCTPTGHTPTVPNFADLAWSREDILVWQARETEKRLQQVQEENVRLLEHNRLVTAKLNVFEKREIQQRESEREADHEIERQRRERYVQFSSFANAVPLDELPEFSIARSGFVTPPKRVSGASTTTASTAHGPSTPQ